MGAGRTGDVWKDAIDLGKGEQTEPLAIRDGHHFQAGRKERLSGGLTAATGPRSPTPVASGFQQHLRDGRPDGLPEGEFTV
jgi:hypothetical protein